MRRLTLCILGIIALLVCLHSCDKDYYAPPVVTSQVQPDTGLIREIDNAEITFREQYIYLMRHAHRPQAVSASEAVNQ